MEDLYAQQAADRTSLGVFKPRNIEDLGVRDDTGGLAHPFRPDNFRGDAPPLSAFLADRVGEKRPTDARVKIQRPSVAKGATRVGQPWTYGTDATVGRTWRETGYQRCSLD